MPRVYVIDALRPRGGAYMAYHVGLILKQQFGYELVSADTQDYPSANQFTYEVTPPRIPLGRLEGDMAADDLLVVNPAFSALMLGLRLPGRKICYVQDFRTFQILDGYFDLYVSVSSTVKKFLRAIYNLNTPIIPAFIERKKLPEVIPWRERPADACMVYVKTGEENRIIADYLLGEFKAKLPALKLQVFGNNGIPHDRFLRHIGKARYLVNISLAEGFGLIPLEAMALGTCVTGFNGVAGRDFMRFGENSMAHNFNEAEQIIPTVKRMLADEAAMTAVSAQAIKDARPYHLKAFRHAWQTVLADFLKS